MFKIVHKISIIQPFIYNILCYNHLQIDTSEGCAQVDIIKNLSLNFFILFTLLFIYLTISIQFRSKSFQAIKSRYAFSTICILAVVLFILFPVHTIGGETFDLRLIPITMIGLYMGWRGHLLLFLFLLAAMWFNKGTIPFVVLASGVVMSIVYGWISPYYLKAKLRIKLFIAVLIGSGMLAFSLIKLIGDHLDVPLFLFFLFINSFALVIMIVFIEFINNHERLLVSLQRAEKMEVVSQLAASISHEVRNPLTSTRGFIQLLLTADLSDKKRDEYGTIALEEIDRAVTIIQNYLSFARSTEDSVEAINLQAVVIKAAEILHPLANLNGVTIQLNTSEAWVFGEQAKMKQCLINLIKNGIEAMPQGGHLTIELEKGDNLVKVRIQDEGVGMSPDHVRRIGEPYYTTKENGTGLGMTSVFRVIESFRGNIHVQSEPNKGTTFTLELPAYNRI